MKVLVDTSVWSLALRRRTPPADSAVAELRTLIEDGRVAMIGPIRQEILSGVRGREPFERLRDHLRAFPDEPLETADFELATEYFTACRAAGLQGSNTDFLICAAAQRRGQPILSTDHDFRRFSAVVPIALYPTR